LKVCAEYLHNILEVLVEIVSQALVYVMLNLSSHLSDLVVEYSYHLEIGGFQLRTLIVYGAICLYEGAVRILDPTSLALIQSFEGLRVVILRNLLDRMLFVRILFVREKEALVESSFI